jgi:hypothetical protein
MEKKLLLAFFAAGFASLASFTAASRPSTSGGTGLAPIACVQDSLQPLPPLSGIDLIPNRSTGTFTLELSQELEEPATVKMSNAKKKVVYTSSLAPQGNESVKHLDVGKLSAGVYLVEVKTSNTTYWKKVRVAHQKRSKR